MEIAKLGQKHVVTVSRDTSLEHAAQLMRENHVGDVVVIDSRGQRQIPVGIVTDRDIVLATVALGSSPSELTAGDIMTGDLVTVRENESLKYVIDVMKRHGVKRVPIVSATERLVGILALEDVMQFLATEFSALAEVSQREKENELERRRKLA